MAKATDKKPADKKPADKKVSDKKPADKKATGKVTAYCLKCKKKDQEMKNPKMITMKNGRKAMKGQCAKCGTNMMKFVAN